MRASELTTNPEQLRITEQHPEILSQPEILESLLMPLETWCLRDMLLKNRPQSSGELYNRITYSLWLKLCNLNDEKIVVLKEDLNKARTIAKYHPKKQQHEPNTKEANLMREVLKDNEIKFPSYRKIESTMEVLESWGFITRRYGQTGNAKYHWVLQPAFLMKYGKTIREYLRDRDITITW